MMVGVPLNTEDPVQREYLFRYFQKTYNDIPAGILTPMDGVDDFNVKNGLILEIKDNVYQQYLTFRHIGLKRVPGSFGGVGEYSSAFVPEQTITITYPPFQFARYKREIVPSYHSYKFQDEVGSYLEVRVYVAVTKHNFDGGGTSQGRTDEALIIPLDRTVVPQLNQNEKEILFAKCMYMFINVVKVIKIKWYQRGAFKVLMMIVAVAIAVVFPPAGVLAWGGYAAVVAFAIAVGVAISVALKLLVKVLVSLGAIS